jgi:glycosyltransferase involved in cell wall biosynthesis
MQGFEENEISVNSQGGTEITKRSIAKLIPEELSNEFQVIPSRLRDLNEEKIRIYWQHDLPEDPEVQHLANANSRRKFHKVVFSSNWQMNDFITKLRMPYDEKLTVIETPIEPFQKTEKPKDTINLIYFSTPHRGLNILVPTFEVLAQKYPNIHLHVFSSFKIYGWEDKDQEFEPLYEQIRNHPQMTYHGFAPQEVLREHLLKSHILAYPNIWPETSCRVLMESMSAGLMCVHPNLAALPDTSGGLTTMYQFNQDMKEHVNVFYQYLDHAIQVVNTDDMQKYLGFVKAYADTRFNITKVSGQWEYLMKDLLIKYPTTESRKIPGEIFVYKTS